MIIGEVKMRGKGYVHCYCVQGERALAADLTEGGNLGPYTWIPSNELTPPSPTDFEAESLFALLDPTCRDAYFRNQIKRRFEGR